MNMDRHKQAGPSTQGTEPSSTGEVSAPASLPNPATEPPPFNRPSSNGSGQSVELHIEDLVLHGFDFAHRYAIGEAIERELTRLSSEQGSTIAATENVEIAIVNGGAIDLKQGSSAEATGIQLARAIHRGLGQ
jgi:hypothetical protein